MKLERINALQHLLEDLRKLHPDMSVGMLITFLEVAKGQGISGRDVEEKLSTNHTTANRLLRYFDTLQSSGQEGMNMFRIEVDPRDYRSKVRFLNDEGVKLLKHLDESLARI